jgi:hypothetical protein
MLWHLRQGSRGTNIPERGRAPAATVLGRESTRLVG